MSLTHEERARALDILRGSEQHLERLLADLNPAQWTFKPAPDAWSISLVAEHIIDLEEKTLAIIYRLLNEPPAPKEEVEQLKGKEEKLIATVPQRNGRRVSAPPGFEVTGKFPTPESALAAFRPLRARSIATLHRDGLHDRMFFHFVFRNLSCYQWLIMLGVHAERHCLQIEEVTASESFPS